MTTEAQSKPQYTPQQFYDKADAPEGSQFWFKVKEADGKLIPATNQQDETLNPNEKWVYIFLVPNQS